MICALCQSSGKTESLFSGLVKCSNCDLVFYPYGANIAEIYSARYFKGEEYRDYVADKEILQRNFASRVRYLKTLHSNGRLFEIGCAFGFFLELAAKTYAVSGIDVSKEAIEYATTRGIPNLQCGDFLKTNLAAESYELLCLWDTIEHLEDPFLYLKKVRDLLVPGGHVVLTTGDIGSIVAKIRGPKWRQIHPPSHLFYFSQKTIRRALEQLGFSNINIQSLGQYRSYRSMLFEIFVLRMPRFRWVYSLFSLNGRIDFPVYLNTFDIMQVTAMKPHRRDSIGT